MAFLHIFPQAIYGFMASGCPSFVVSVVWFSPLWRDQRENQLAGFFHKRVTFAGFVWDFNVYLPLFVWDFDVTSIIYVYIYNY